MCIDCIREAAAGAPVTLVSPFWRGDPAEKRLSEVMQRLRLLLKAEAARAGFYFIDGLSVLPHEPAFCNDGYLHPNDLGFSVCARVLAGQLAR